MGATEVNCAQYIVTAKTVLGDPRMSDRELGLALARFNRGRSFGQQAISKAKARMSDEVALAIGELLSKHQKVVHPGEVVLVAHSERDADPHVRRALADYAKGVAGEWRKRSVSTRGPRGLAVSARLFEVPAS
jgi:hypothetical protein